jgi:hypothetical protein
MDTDPARGRDFDLPRHSHYSGVIPMVFEHSGGRDFDLPRHSHYSGVIPMVFEHSAAGVRAENLINIFIVYRIVLQPVGSRLCVCLCLDDVSLVCHTWTL